MPSLACSGMVTDTSKIPHVMHGPYHRLGERQQSVEPRKRQHALIDPIETYDVGLANEAVTVERQSVRGQIDLKQKVASQSVGKEYFEPFGKEWPFYTG